MDSKRAETGNVEIGSNPLTKEVKEYKSEYKKNFLPFSQYEYIDGKFFKKKGSHQESDSPWYKEVIELRQKAGEYKFRGWGTELGTTVVVPAFNHQLWKHVSHKSSFNALALITTTSRGLAKKEKSKETATNVPSGQSAKPGIRRPHTATPKHPLGSEVDSSKVGKDEDAKSSTSGKVKQVKPLRPSQTKGRSQSAEPGLRYKRNLPSKQGGAVGPPGPAGSVPVTDHHHRGDGTGASWKTKDSSDSPAGDSSSLAKHRRPSSVDRSLDGTDEIVIKSPPEPTRVKSPDQVKLRSPDPVNWMVPLDTTRGFTVTQSLPKGPAVAGA